MDDYIPYCGLPPTPAELLSRWTLEPGLLIGLTLALILGLSVARNRRNMMFGWVLVVLLFISPICAASMALFSARVGQHIALTLIAAPIIAAGLPRVPFPPMPMALLFAALFWTWHTPMPYAATLQSDLAYWAMHISLTGAAIALFVALRAARERAILAAAFTAAQLTTFATILTLTPTVWHGWHALTTAPYGVTALEDQQIAGSLMWVAGGGVFMVLVAGLAWRILHGKQASEGTASKSLP